MSARTVGYFTRRAARLAGPTGGVFSFEPDNYALPRRTYERTATPTRPSRRRQSPNGTASCGSILSDKNERDHRIYDSHDGRLSISIKAVSLDRSFGEQALRVALIKIDIQGSEPGALHGMDALLRRHNTDLPINAEFWPQGLAYSGSSPEACLDLLDAHGFRLFNLGTRGNGVLPIGRAEQISRYSVEEYTILLCLKERAELP